MGGGGVAGGTAADDHEPGRHTVEATRSARRRPPVRSARMRVVLCLGLHADDPFQLAPARLHEPPWISGGVRDVHELAVAAAAAGYETEVRGDFDRNVLAELCAGRRGARSATPAEPPGRPSPTTPVRPRRHPRPRLLHPRRPHAEHARVPRAGAAGPVRLVVRAGVAATRTRSRSTRRASAAPSTARAIDALGYVVWSNAPTITRRVRGRRRPGSEPRRGVARARPGAAGEGRRRGDDRREPLGAGHPPGARRLPAARGASCRCCRTHELMTELGRGRVVRALPPDRGRLRARRPRRGAWGPSASVWRRTGSPSASTRRPVACSSNGSKTSAAVVEEILADPGEVARRRARARAQSVGGDELAAVRRPGPCRDRRHRSRARAAPRRPGGR